MMHKYQSIQSLRFVAAALVVVAHATQAVSMRMHGDDGSDYWKLGTIGVDIFFVISGFIMAITTRATVPGWRPALDFMRRRLIRIFPLYWLYTTAKLLILLVLPAASIKVFPTTEHIVASYFLIPHPDAAGNIWPVLPVGWTLSFELSFYLVFAMAIATTRYRAVFTAVAFAALAAAAQLRPQSQGLQFLANSFLLEFLYGVMLAALAPRLVHWANKPRLLLAGAVGCVATALALMGWAPSLPRGLAYGVPSALVVAAFVILEWHGGARRWLMRLGPLGDASYSLYLAHTFVVPALVSLFGVVLGVQPLVVLLLVLASSVVVSLLSYRWLERPMTVWLGAWGHKARVTVPR